MKFGIATTWIGIGNAILGSLLAWVVLGRRTRLMSQHLKSATMPEFFGMRYCSTALKIVASIIVSMLGGLVIVPVVSLFTKKLNKEVVDYAFECYDRKVVVSAKEALGDE